MSWHGRKWWLAWRDSEAKTHFENAGTDDPREAQRMLAERTLPRARAIVETLERIAHGEVYEKDPGDRKAGGKTAKPRGTGRTRGKAASAARKSAGTKKGKTR